MIDIQTMRENAARPISQWRSYAQEICRAVGIGLVVYILWSYAELMAGVFHHGM